MRPVRGTTFAEMQQNEAFAAATTEITSRHCPWDGAGSLVVMIEFVYLHDVALEA